MLIELFIFTLMIVPTATTIALLLLFLTPSCGYVSSLRVFFTSLESTRTIPLPSLDHSQRSQQMTLAATNDPVAPLPLASATEPERKLAELERKLERVERKLDEVEVERKQGENSIISCIHIVDRSDVYI